MENTQDGTLEGWFKITVPYGMKYDKIWLMNSIQSHCSVPITPVAFTVQTIRLGSLPRVLVLPLHGRMSAVRFVMMQIKR